MSLRKKVSIYLFAFALGALFFFVLQAKQQTNEQEKTELRVTLKLVVDTKVKKMIEFLNPYYVKDNSFKKRMLTKEAKCELSL